MSDERDRDLRALYRAAATESPPAALNSRILEAARRSVRSPLARFTPFGGHWPLGLSAAAVVMVCATLLVYLVDMDDPYLEEHEVAGRAVAPGDVRPRHAVEADAEMAADGLSSPEPPPAVKREQAPQQREAVSASKPAVPAPARSPGRDEGTVGSRASSSPTPGNSTGGGVAAPAGKAAAPAPPAARQSLSDGVATPEAAPKSAMERRDADGDPEHQLAAIQRLVETGNETAARRLLREFVDRYPEHPLPAALETLLGTRP